MRLIWAIIFANLIGSLAIAEPLDFWNLRFAETNYGASGGVFGKGKFIIGGASILTSDDGQNWRRTLADSGVRLTQGNGVFLATGAGGKLHVSNDGETWITKRNPVGAGTSSLAFGNGIFLLQTDDDSHTLLCSTNGLDWRTCSTHGPFQGITFCNDRFLTIGPDPQQSFDGATFQPATGWPPFRSVAFLNGVWVATDYSDTGIQPRSISASTNGLDWVSFLPTPYASEDNAVSVAGDLFVLTIGKEFFFVSKDGFNWVDHQVAVGFRYRVHSIVHGADSMLAVVRFSQDTPKPGILISVDQIYQSRPLTAAPPTVLSVSLLPALTLKDGFPGTGYDIESSSTIIGPWSVEKTVFPERFPYVILAPNVEGNGRFYRSRPR